MSNDVFEKILENKEFHLVFQKVVNSDATATIHHYEALLRLRNKGLNLEDFFKWIEQEISRATALDLAVLEIALQALTDNPELRVAVNVSALSPISAAFCREYVKKIFLAKIEGRFFIEITETAKIKLWDMPKVDFFLKSLKVINVESYVDDFRGSQDLFKVLFWRNFSKIKLDRCIIEAGETQLKLYVTLCRLLRKQVVVEGIENQKQADLCLRFGVLTQGYFYGRPSAL